MRLQICEVSVGKWRRVVWLHVSKVSDETASSILHRSTQKMEAADLFETLVSGYYTAWLYAANNTVG
jgi:hypothetical protein